MSENQMRCFTHTIFVNYVISCKNYEIYFCLSFKSTFSPKLKIIYFLFYFNCLLLKIFIRFLIKFFDIPSQEI